MNWKEILEELLKDLEYLAKIVKHADSQRADSQADSQQEDSDDRWLLIETIFSEHLHLDSYNKHQVDAYLKGLATILEEADSVELYNLGVLLIFLANKPRVADEMRDLLVGNF
jgi:hypothetical protein